MNKLNQQQMLNLANQLTKSKNKIAKKQLLQLTYYLLLVIIPFFIFMQNNFWFISLTLSYFSDLFIWGFMNHNRLKMLSLSYDIKQLEMSIAANKIYDKNDHRIKINNQTYQQQLLAKKAKFKKSNRHLIRLTGILLIIVNIIIIGRCLVNTVINAPITALIAAGILVIGVLCYTFAINETDCPSIKYKIINAITVLKNTLLH